MNYLLAEIVLILATTIIIIIAMKHLLTPEELLKGRLLGAQRNSEKAIYDVVYRQKQKEYGRKGFLAGRGKQLQCRKTGVTLPLD